MIRFPTEAALERELATRRAKGFAISQEHGEPGVYRELRLHRGRDGATVVLAWDHDVRPRAATPAIATVVAALVALLVVLGAGAAYARPAKARAPIGRQSDGAHDQRGTSSMASKNRTPSPPSRKADGEALLALAAELSAKGLPPSELRGLRLRGRELRGDVEDDFREVRELAERFRERFVAAGGGSPLDLAAMHVLGALYVLLTESGGAELEKMHAIARPILKDAAKADSSLLVPVETTRGRNAPESLVGQFDELVPLAEELLSQRTKGRTAIAAVALVARAYEIVPGSGGDPTGADAVTLGTALGERARVVGAVARSAEGRRSEAEKLCENLLREMLQRVGESSAVIRRRMQFRTVRSKRNRRG